MSENYPQLPPNSNLILACHITGVYDVNRSTTLQDDNFELVRAWAESVAAAKVNGLLFHNGFSEETCQTYANEYLTFVKITYNPQFNPNVYRYLVYLDFLEKQANPPANIFVTDVSDVTLVNNPFTDPVFIASTNTLFFPNPARYELNMKSDVTVERVVICDIVGKTLSQQIIKSNTAAIDIRSLPQGVYILDLYAADGYKIGAAKFVKE